VALGGAGAKNEAKVEARPAATAPSAAAAAKPGPAADASPEPEPRGGATPPTPLAPEVIDVHAHIGHFRGFDLSEATLLANLVRRGVRLALISNIDGAALPGVTGDLDERAANDAAAAAVDRHPDRLRAIAWTRPPSSDGSALVRYFAPGPDAPRYPFVGIKLHPEMNSFDADDPVVDPYFALAERFHVPIVVHSGSPFGRAAPAKIYAAARRHPKVSVVLYHMGMGGVHDEAISAARDAKAKGDADLYLETAQAAPRAVVRAVRTLCADRVLFGTDATYFGAEHYEAYEPLFRELAKALTPEERALVYAGNARRLFKLPAP
jgi:predicted TIM-barrel fold metal-dependent hydrolase